MKHRITQAAVSVIILLCLTVTSSFAQKHKTAIPAKSGAALTGNYRNVLLEAEYSQDSINQKVAEAYHNVFEGPDKVYFEVGDTMAYVLDVKNHDARTEGLSYYSRIQMVISTRTMMGYCIYSALCNSAVTTN